MQINRLLLLISPIFYLLACATSPNMDFEQPNPKGNRTLILGDEVFKEGEPWQFLSWKCRDFINGGKTLVEVGRALFPHDYKYSSNYRELTDEKKQELDKFLKIVGFVLYDGTDTGDLTFYHRDGLTHRWDWGGDKRSYSFVIKTDGTGLYYDFSTSKDGFKSKADDIFKCSR